MQINLEPKAQFLKLTETAEKYRQLTSGEILIVACNYAMSQFSMGGVTAEQLEGAKKFLAILLNLGERPDPESTYPQKALQHPERQTLKPKDK
jgi:hypothetical protein